MSKKLTDEQREALRQKDALLAAGKYAAIPHGLYRIVLPELAAKYDGTTARDCVFLYAYFHSNVNGQAGQAAYMWAYPTVLQIVDATGIDKNRVKGLVDILESEGLILTRRIPWNGHTRKMYMPLYPERIL